MLCLLPRAVFQTGVKHQKLLRLRFRVIPSAGEVNVGEELLIASRRIAFALTDTLANEAHFCFVEKLTMFSDRNFIDLGCD